MKSLIILALPSLILAKIKIEVTRDNEAEQAIDYSGNTLSIISEREIRTFNVTETNLISCVKAYFGSEPTNVFLKNPTAFDDLYTTYDWKQVTRSLRPDHAKILTVTSSSMLVLTNVFNNTSWRRTKFKATIRQAVNNTIYSKWKKTGRLDIKDEISYKFNMTGHRLSGRLIATYSSQWGENVRISEKVMAGSELPVQVILEPKQIIVANLVAIKDVTEVEIHYIASLYGAAVANYEEPYKDHHFWSLDLNTVLKACGLRNHVKSSEMIRLSYYTRSKIIFRDFSTNEVLKTIPFKIYKA